MTSLGTRRQQPINTGGPRYGSNVVAWEKPIVKETASCSIRGRMQVTSSFVALLFLALFESFMYKEHNEKKSKMGDGYRFCKVKEQLSEAD